MKAHIILPALLLTSLARAAEPVGLQLDTVDGAEVIRLENYRVKLVISPARGGAVTSYSDKLAPAELILQKPFQGLCLDHFQEQNWPGELLETPYEYRVVKQTPDEVQVMLVRTVIGRWPADKPVNPKLAGILVEKTYALRADSPALTCRVKLTMPADAAKTFAYWLQNVFFAGGDYDAATDRTFRPSARGVRNNAAEKNGHYGKEEWLRDFTAGWQTIVDTEKGTGLVMLSDYDDLKVTYACGGNATLEFMFNPLYLPAGQSREYTVHLVPVAGLKKVTHADPHLVVAATVSSDNKGGGRIEFQAVRSVNAPGDVKLDVQLFGPSDKKETAAGSVSLPVLTDQPQAAALSFADGPVDPLVIRVRATSGDQAGKFEDFFAGAYAWGDNITTDMRTPVYAAERPPQKLNLVKPEKLAIKAGWGGRYLFFYGAWDDEYDIAKAIHTLGWHAKTDISYYSYGGQWLGSLTEFPYDYEKLLGYNAIILGGVSRSGLRPIGVEMLHDYLLAGGGLVVLGSHGAYGRAQLRGTKLAEAFPVEWPEGLASLKQIGSQPVTFGPDPVPFRDGIEFSNQARCYFLHTATPKAGAQVLMQCNGQPLLVAGEYGLNKARIVCLLGAPFGAPAQDEVPFWRDKEWHYLLRNALWWAGRQADAFPGTK